VGDVVSRSRRKNGAVQREKIRNWQSVGRKYPLPVRTADFKFELPPNLIAQFPAERRDQSRLLVVNRSSGSLEHRQFPNLKEYLRHGDVLVLNNSQVIRARLRGRNARTRGAFEILLLEENSTNDWWTMMKPGKRARVGTRIEIRDRTGSLPGIEAVVVERNDEGHRRLKFSGVTTLLNELESVGELPLPPYIQRDPEHLPPSDAERYQTVFAQPPGSVAAPTAGLHFTPQLLEAIRARGVEIHFVTLHVGLGTFAPVKTEHISAHVMHDERFDVGVDTAAAINSAKQAGRRVIAVGTTSVRVLESVARQHNGQIVPGAGRTRIFLYPPAEFSIVDVLLTNFHLPCSTLLMLVSAFASPGKLEGRNLVLHAYAKAIRERYRFFSYGDAMLIL